MICECDLLTKPSINGAHYTDWMIDDFMQSGYILLFFNYVWVYVHSIQLLDYVYSNAWFAQRHSWGTTLNANTFTQPENGKISE